jgi:hypothetical protein
MAAAIGCISGQVLLVAIYVAVTSELIWRPGAPASATGLATSLFPAVDAAAFPAPENLTAGPKGVEPRLRPAAAPGVDPQLKALRADLHALVAKLERAESRVTGVESRVNSVELSMRRLGDDVASAAATRPVERAPSAPRHVAAKPDQAAPLPPAPPPVMASSEPVAQPSPPPAYQVRPLAEAVAPSARSMQSLETKASTIDSGPSRAARAPSDDASSSNTLPNLKDKLHDDWRAIKQGFASAGDDFKATMRDFARRVRGE